LFVAESDPRAFASQLSIAAPIETVFAVWSAGEFFAQTYDPGSATLKVKIDLVIGGRYEWLWDGETGSNDCQVLSFIPDRMISFSWNAPPSHSEGGRPGWRAFTTRSRPGDGTDKGTYLCS
jgi:uncharacterized protein YndB with AHSA1/START domain